MKNWRIRTKARIVAAFGGACCVCGYNHYNGALELHHLDPNAKEMSISKMSSCPRSWATIVQELRKCVMVCANCHREVHAKLTAIPDHATRFDEAFATNRKLWTGSCDVCGKPTQRGCVSCSKQCSNSKKQKCDWSIVDLADYIVNRRMSYADIGRILGVTGAAVKRRWISDSTAPSLGL